MVWIREYRKIDRGRGHAIECWETYDRDAPDGVGWNYNEYVLDERGAWREHDGGVYWDYPDAKALCDELCGGVPVTAREFAREVLGEEA